MKLTNLFVLIALTAASSQAAPKWLRWTSAAAVCSAAAYQTYQGYRAVDAHYSAQPKWSISVVGAIGCGASLWNASRNDHSTIRTLANFGGAGVFAGFGISQKQSVDNYLRDISVRRPTVPGNSCPLTPGCARSRQ